MKRFAIIDDEQHARKTLRRFLGEHCPEVEIVGEADGVASGHQLILAHQPDAVLLDIAMKDGTGFDLLDRFSSPSFKVIFTTAFDDFALKAFGYNALDYLLKPIVPEDLVKAITKIQQDDMKEFSQKVTHVLQSAQARSFKKIGLSSQEGLVFLPLTDIVRLEADGNYTTFFMENQERHIVVRPLKEFEDLLPSKLFFRIHQSHIVNLDFVKKYLREDGGMVLMETGEKIIVARRRKEDFLEMLKNNSL